MRLAISRASSLLCLLLLVFASCGDDGGSKTTDTVSLDTLATDSASADTAGADTASVDTNACVPDCSVGLCGDDGCGGSCFDCPAGFTCDSFRQCVCAQEPCF